MPTSVLTVIACSPVLAGWLCVYGRRLMIRWRHRVHAEQHAEQWAQMAACLTDLDADLELAWAAEQDRIRRYR